MTLWQFGVILKQSVHLFHLLGLRILSGRHFPLKGIRVSLLQVQTVHYATSFKALSFNLSM